MAKGPLIAAVIRPAGFLTIVGLCVEAALAASAPPGPQAACAAFDTHILTLIEDHADLGSATHQDLAAARDALDDARRACRLGDYARGLDLYGAIPLTSVPAGSFHRIWIR